MVGENPVRLYRMIPYEKLGDWLGNRLLVRNVDELERILRLHLRTQLIVVIEEKANEILRLDKAQMWVAAGCALRVTCEAAQ